MRTRAPIHTRGGAHARGRVDLPAAVALGPDHPIARASGWVCVVRRQAGVTLLATVLASVCLGLSEPYALEALSASLAVEVALLLLLALACQLRRERVWEAVAGGSEALVKEIAHERARLDSPRGRFELSQSLRLALHAAENWNEILVASRPPAGVRVLGRFGPQIRHILKELEAPAADVRALAHLALLLSGGYSAGLYSGDETAVRDHLTRIAEMLAASNDPRADE